MIDRAAGAALVALAAAAGALPALPWYAAPAPGGAATTTGFRGAGELWLLPPLAAAAALAGLALLVAPASGRHRTRRVAGSIALLAGALALAWALRAALDPRVALVVSEDGGGQEIAAPVTLEPAAVATPLVTGALALVALAVAAAGWSAGGRGAAG